MNILIACEAYFPCQLLSSHLGDIVGSLPSSKIAVELLDVETLPLALLFLKSTIAAEYEIAEAQRGGQYTCYSSRAVIQLDEAVSSPVDAA